MINFRFHLVSLVAVFLALALGIVMGSTVIDRAIVDGLKNRIDAVEARADARRRENLELEQRVAGLEGYVEQSVAHLVAGRLEDVTVTVVAVRGVDDDAVEDTVEMLRSAGGTVPGVVWVEASLGVPDVATHAKLAEAVGEPTNPGDDLVRVTAEALGRRLAHGPRLPSGSPPLLTGAEDVLVALAAAGFVRFDTLGGGDVLLGAYPPAPARVLVVNGTGGAVPNDHVVLPLIRTIANAGVPAAFGEVHLEADGGPPRGQFVGAVRDDPALAALVATVDDLETVRGRVAVTLALDELGRGQAGHYGEAPGATAQLPEPATLNAAGRVPAS